jgi:hypothetical protein
LTLVTSVSFLHPDGRVAVRNDRSKASVGLK